MPSSPLSRALLVIPAAGLVLTAAAPGLLRARIARNEAAAVAALRALQNAETIFAARCGHGAFATSFDDLAAGLAGAAPPPPRFVRDHWIRRGTAYTLRLEPDASQEPAAPPGAAAPGTPAPGAPAKAAATACVPLASPLAPSYFAAASPSGVDTGMRHFATDARGRIVYAYAPVVNPLAAARATADLPPELQQ